MSCISEFPFWLHIIKGKFPAANEKGDNYMHGFTALLLLLHHHHLLHCYFVLHVKQEGSLHQDENLTAKESFLLKFAQG